MTGPPGPAGHLFGDVQRFGLRSAALVVDRYTGVVDRVLAAAVPEPSLPFPDGATTDEGIPEEPVRLLKTLAQALESAAAALSGATARDDASADVLVLPPVTPGAVGEGALWVHNPTPSPVTCLQVHATDLVSPAGDRLDAGTFSPPAVDRVEAGGSREIRLRVAVPAGAPPAQYHGLVLLSAAPDEPMTVRLHVLPDAGAPA